MEKTLRTVREEPAVRLASSFWRVTAALAATMLAASLMNIVVFPLFDDVFTHARDISQVVQAAFFLIMGVVASFRPLLIDRLPMEIASIAALALGAALIPCALAVGNAALLVASSSLFAFGRGGVVLAVSLALARVLPEERNLLMAVAAATVLAVALRTVCWLVPVGVGFVLYVALPFAAYFLVRHDTRAVVKMAAQGEAPSDAAITRPKSFLPLASQFFVAIFLFRVAFGIALRMDELTNIVISALFGIVPVGAIVLLLVLWRRFDVDRLVQTSVLFVMVGFLCLNYTGASLGELGSCFITSGNELFGMAFWIVIAAVASRNLSGAMVVAGWGNGVSAVGTIVGAAFGVQGVVMVEQNPEMLFLLSSAFLILFVGYALVGLNNFSFKRTVEGVVPVEAAEVKAEAPEEVFEKRCASIAEAHGLTKREREVFAMLARGRNREYIQETLVLSRSTVKTHVRHIYEKLGIHSHQELIDLVYE